MINQKYSEILNEIFGILGFTDVEKTKATEVFKKKLAFEILKLVEPQLPPDQRDWINNTTTPVAANDQKLLDIQATINQLYGPEQLLEKSRSVFRKLLEEYIEFMSSDLSPEEISQIKTIIEKV